MSYKIKVFHLYPDAMNLYGDLGNILALKQRCIWRGLDFEVVDVKIGDKVDFRDADIIFMGGGQDRGQKVICNDLIKRGRELVDRIDEGLVALTICGGFQLFGKYFKTKDGEEIKGIGAFDSYTVGGDRRFIGNVVIDFSEASTRWDKMIDQGHGALKRKTLVGFENHSGLTTLGPKTEPLGEVVIGYGNKGDGGTEGGVYKNAFGTYLHGSLLPKNPHFADHLISLALEKRYGARIPLDALDDSWELAAHDAAIERAKTAKTLSI